MAFGTTTSNEQNRLVKKTEGAYFLVDVVVSLLVGGAGRGNRNACLPALFLAFAYGVVLFLSGAYAHRPRKVASALGGPGRVFDVDAVAMLLLLLLLLSMPLHSQLRES